MRQQGNVISSFMVLLFAIGIGFYFWVSFWDTMTDPFSTTIAYSYTVSESADTHGILLREEYLLPATSGLLDVVRTEGEQVGVGQLVGRVYRDASAMEEQNYLEARMSEVEVLEYAVGEKKDIITVSKMDQEIVSAFSSLRVSLATGNLQKLENEIADVQGEVLRRDFVFGNPAVVKSLEDRYETLLYEIQHSQKSISAGVTPITTPVSGAFSILVDGYENITFQEAQDFSVAQLEELLQYESALSTAPGSGKIITGNTWYFATVLESYWAEYLQEGKGITVRFSGDISKDIVMTVESIGQEEEGKRVILLSSNRFLEETTLLRVQRVELVYESYTGLRVPKQAMRMETRTNYQTGESYEVYGVYVMSAGYAEFKSAEILGEGKDFFVIQGLESNANLLREGDEVVVNAVGLYHGKLLEY